MNRWLFAMAGVALCGGCFFLKNIPLTPVLESPLPAPSHTIFSQKDPTPFALEYTLAKSCLQDLSLSTTLYSFKKAHTLATSQEETSQALYGLIFTHFLAKQFDELKNLYLKSARDNLDPNAPYYKDAMLMFYIAFKTKQVPFVTGAIKNYLDQDPTLKANLELFEKISEGALNQTALNPLYQQYIHKKKSTLLAGSCNLLLPGSGYFYLHQKQSALTAFILLSLLGWATFALLKQKQLASALLVFTIFTGFYWGSIVGATQAASFYNNTLYSHYVEPLLKEQKLYPELMISYAP